MVDWIYQFLANIGYTHPIHPALVHVPIGNVIAALIFGVIGLALRKQGLGRAAYYALVLAFFSLIPGIFFAVTDWLRYFGGVWLFWIKMKVALAAILTVLLFIAIVTGRRDAGATSRTVILTFLCFLTIVGLGYYGANLVYSGIPRAPTKELEEGRQIFAVNCRFCHPQGGNVIRPSLPVLGASQLSDVKTFTSYLRNPLLPNGEKGGMPVFSSSKISDRQIEALYAYVKQVLEKQTVPGVGHPGSAAPGAGPGEKR
jgi:mono/diheme cytochrome c family protein